MVCVKRWQLELKDESHKICNVKVQDKKVTYPFDEPVNVYLMKLLLEMLQSTEDIQNLWMIYIGL